MVVAVRREFILTAGNLMKQILPIAVLAAAALTGCTTYPQNYTYSPTVNVTGGNKNDVVLPSPYAKKPQPVPQRPADTVFVTNEYNDSPQPRTTYGPPFTPGPVRNYWKEYYTSNDTGNETYTAEGDIPYYIADRYEKVRGYYH